MVDSKRLLADLTKLLRVLEADLRSQAAERNDVRAVLKADYEAARTVGRTQSPFETWVEEPLTQAGVAWILGTVFVRFLEDNGLVEPGLSGSGARRTRAMQEHQHYFQQHPTGSDRDYLESLFAGLLDVPATAPLFDRRHNPLWRVPISADAARQLVDFWQRIDPASGEVSHDFADGTLDTRFLGDLYQDLSESVRKRYALLQTPRFVESFILDRTLTPAIEAFGYRETTVIDPTCGSGHFLLGAFDRLLDLAQTHEPGKDVRALVQDVLTRVAGIDINPYAVAISRFRLMVAALRACAIRRLAEAPAFDIRVAAADSLLHGPRFSEGGEVARSLLPDDPSEQYYFAEDDVRVRAILGRQYHAVIGNPPYITVKDPALNALYRQRFGSCHRQYSLVVPFLERFFELAMTASDAGRTTAGFVGMIVGNSFMKREFGKKVIEEYLRRLDLTDIADTSRAHIPGHGTPTVILFGRHRRPQLPTVRVAMGIKAEAVRPVDASRGAVWTAIVRQLDQPGSESEFVTVSDLDRATLYHHPWSIGGGGAAELKEAIETDSASRLGDMASSVGFVQDTHADEAFVQPRAFLHRLSILTSARAHRRGEDLRDWATLPAEDEVILFPFDQDLNIWTRIPSEPAWCWFHCLRTMLWERRAFSGKSYRTDGRPWFDYHQFPKDRLRSPLSIAFAFVATHNHFVLDHDGKVFNRSAPVIKLSAEATEEDHLALLGLLNSSTACFWLKQACHNKGGGGIGGGLATEVWEQFYEFTAGAVGQYPVVPCKVAALARELSAVGVATTALSIVTGGTLGDLQSMIAQVRSQSADSLASGMTLQEELDWEVYRAYGLLTERLTYVGEPPPLELGQRAFEIVMARKMAAGELETTWFARHGSTPIAELPGHWPEDYKQLVERRIELIENDRYIGLIEQPEYKRRWNLEPFNERLNRELRSWLLDRLEAPEYWDTVAISSAAKLADRVRQDPRFMEVAGVYTGQPDFDVTQLVADLVSDESVPFLPALRYTEFGLRKRVQWEETWRLQRAEDAIDARTELPAGHADKLTSDDAKRLKAQQVGEIPVPPKYAGADFKAQSFWRLRGKLDVPRERFVSYPGCDRRADGSLPIAWAGWDHAQQARALGAYYMLIKGEEGSDSPKLKPLLVGLLELLPWIRQWHGGLDLESGMELAPFYESFVDSEARSLGLTVEDLRRWTPPESGGGRRRRSASKRARTE